MMGNGDVTDLELSEAARRLFNLCCVLDMHHDSDVPQVVRHWVCPVISAWTLKVQIAIFPLLLRDSPRYLKYQTEIGV